MEKSKLSKQIDFDAAALEIAMFQQALEKAYRQVGILNDYTIGNIVVAFANRVMFERDLSAAPKAEAQAPQA